MNTIRNTTTPLNLDEVRKNALNSIDQGALTSDYALDARKACQLLNEDLASEILCVLRYRHHQIAAKGINYPQVAAHFKEHAEEEEVHAMMIAERINQLGGEANFHPGNILKGAATLFGQGGDLTSMIRDDLVAERISIQVYRNHIRWFESGDPTTRRMLEEILEDEEEHANDMADLLAHLGPPKNQRLHS